MERSHRIDQEGFYRVLDGGVVIGNTGLFKDRLPEWENFYNLAGVALEPRWPSNETVKSRDLILDSRVRISSCQGRKPFWN